MDIEFSKLYAAIKQTISKPIDRRNPLKKPTKLPAKSISTKTANKIVKMPTDQRQIFFSTNDN